MPTYLKDGGAWNQARGVFIKDAGTWKPAKKVYIKDAGVWKIVFDSFPTGIILPYDSTSTIPTGFVRFTAADGRLVVGAGDTYAVNSTGGSSSVSISATTTTQGDHLGPGNTGSYSYQGGSNSVNDNNITRGNHNHTFTGSGTVAPAAKNIILIKATDAVTVLPQNVGVFKHTTGAPPGMTRASGIQDRYVKSAAASVALDGSSTASIAVTTSTSGSHAAHSNVQGSPYAYYSTPFATAGAHTHTGTMNGTATPLYRYLNLYLAATATVVPSEAVIGMWESNTPPDGWYVCDGTNGTPDLRNYFIRITDSDTGLNNTGGANSIAFSGSFSATPNHNHGTSISGSIFQRTVYHANNFSMPTHTGSQTVSFTPPYYALIFIMKQP